jgi:hypothetical protein
VVRIPNATLDSHRAGGIREVSTQRRAPTYSTRSAISEALAPDGALGMLDEESQQRASSIA